MPLAARIPAETIVIGPPAVALWRSLKLLAYCYACAIMKYCVKGLPVWQPKPISIS